MIIRVKSGVNRHEIIRHDTASAVNGTAEFLGLYFQWVGEVNAVGIHQFTVVEALYQVFIVICRAVVRLLDAAAGGSIITGDRQADHWAVGQVDRALNQSFAKRTAAYDDTSVPILHCAADNLTGGSCIFVYQYDEVAVTELAVTFGVEVTTFGSPSFGVDD